MDERKHDPQRPSERLFLSFLLSTDEMKKASTVPAPVHTAAQSFLKSERGDRPGKKIRASKRVAAVMHRSMPRL